MVVAQAIINAIKRCLAYGRRLDGGSAARLPSAVFADRIFSQISGTGARRNPISTKLTILDHKASIPRSPNYPVIFLGDDAEVVGDGVAPLVCVLWDSIPEKTEHSVDELGEGRVVVVVGDVLMHDPP